ncbi:signal peptidase I [Taibaiella helva]|uniref:signal peptidase I n=1 Tax=Taibaiella helva TaxID=2301235 RepID=UPI0018E55255|nr:signal peptidase I [Taibaiella helva]
MEWSQLPLTLAFIFIAFVLPVIGLYKMFQKAGIPAWLALIPVLNTWHMLRLTRRPKWWIAAQLIPFLGYIFTIGIFLEFVRCFGKTKFYQQALTAVAPFAYFLYIGFNRKDQYQAPSRLIPVQGPRKLVREWVDAAAFAVVAATIIRTFFIEGYTIPSGSMEGTLLTNDYLFVSKSAYGARMPMTPLAVPLVHNTLPLTGGRSYSDLVQWDYHRLPGMGKVKRYDIVVFNVPHNDTAMADAPGRDYYAAVRNEGRETVWRRTSILTRPVDKKEHFIKRCVGIPGDQVEIRDGLLYVNGVKGNSFPHQRTDYRVQAQSGFYLSPDYTEEQHILYKGTDQAGNLILEMEQQTAAAIAQLSKVAAVTLFTEPKGYLDGSGRATFPQNKDLYPWNQDNYGPILIPGKGTTIDLNPATLALYARAIRTYEKNRLDIRDGRYYLNGKPATQYTFKMNYYWMMGDNRHNSEDSRFWGFVPADHIVGKASFVWLSYGGDGEDGPSSYTTKNGIRWDRLFRGVGALQQ